mmetsp:Transcript_54034/g.128735  ORF Transcript_54034/g.128735 Transcript_54034/m.128735 type:complete len:290 (-) Transcript_54034:79-948(-)
MASSRTPLAAAEASKAGQLRHSTLGFALGPLIAWAGLLLYHGLNLLLLTGHCTERGCFQANCTTKPSDNQCFPPLSDTYIVYDPTFASYSRRVLVLVVATVRAFVIPFLVTCSHHLLAKHGQLWCGALRTLALGLIMVSQAIFDLLSIIFWNKGAYGQTHKVLSSVLILHWLIGVLPVWNLAMSAIPELRLGACINWGLWVFAWVDVVWLRKTVSTCDWWIWYVMEWLVIITQGTSIVVGGLSMPRSFRLCRPDGVKRPMCVPAWALLPMLEEDIMHDDIETMHDEDGL